MNTDRNQLLYIGAPLVACLLTLISTQLSNRVDAQAGCTNCLPSTATIGRENTWAQNTAVTVNISPMFNAEQRRGIEQAFRNWQNNQGNAGITYTFTSNSTPVSGTPNTIQVNSENPAPINGQQPQATTFPTRNNTNTNLQSVIIQVHRDVTNEVAMLEAIAHEIGHTYGLADCPTCCDGSSVMTGANSFNDVRSGTGTPSACDRAVANSTGNYTPTPTPTPEVVGGFEGYNGTLSCGIDVPASCQDGVDNDGDLDIDVFDEGCICPSPVIVDVLGNGFNLTDAVNGVAFDLNSDGSAESLSWTALDSDDAWLALDRNGNGLVDNGQELFGNYTPQPPSAEPNGFLALAEFDRAESGGNDDGRLDSGDAVFSSLRLWQDVNHNGISEPDELHSLPALGVAQFELNHRQSRRRDAHGNWFRYRAKVRDVRGAQVGRWAWDVFLVRAS